MKRVSLPPDLHKPADKHRFRLFSLSDPECYFFPEHTVQGLDLYRIHPFLISEPDRESLSAGDSIAEGFHAHFSLIPIFQANREGEGQFP